LKLEERGDLTASSLEDISVVYLRIYSQLQLALLLNKIVNFTEEGTNFFGKSLAKLVQVLQHGLAIIWEINGIITHSAYIERDLLLGAVPD
jgi:hypothetical protein